MMLAISTAKTMHFFGGNLLNVAGGSCLARQRWEPGGRVLGVAEGRVNPTFLQGRNG